MGCASISLGLIIIDGISIRYREYRCIPERGLALMHPLVIRIYAIQFKSLHAVSLGPFVSNPVIRVCLNIKISIKQEILFWKIFLKIVTFQKKTLSDMKSSWNK